MSARARQEMIKVCRLGWERGYLSGRDGNLSLRLDGGLILMTPSSLSKAWLEPRDLLVLDAEARVVEGLGRPSSEARLHLAALAQRPDAGAVVHAHPPLCTALTVAGLNLDISAQPEMLAALGAVPTVPYAAPGSGGLAQGAASYWKDYDALLLAHHGVATLGSDLETAWARTEKLEHAAQVFMAALSLGGPQELPPEEQARLLVLGGRGEEEDETPSPLAKRIEHTVLPLTADFAVEKRHEDARGQAHLIVDDRPLRRLALLTLEPGTGSRGGHMHRVKREGFYVVQGRARVELVCARSGERLTLELNPGSRLWIPPQVAHRIEALESLTFVEFTDSAYDPDDDLKFVF